MSILKRTIFYVICLILLFSHLLTMSDRAYADGLPMTKTVSVTMKLVGKHVASNFAVSKAYDDGTYAGMLTRQDGTIKNVVRSMVTVTKTLQSDTTYPIDKPVAGQYTFPTTTTGTYVDSLSMQTITTTMSKSGSQYFYGSTVIKYLYADHHGYSYDPDNHSTLGYMSNNSTTYYGGQNRYANPPRQPATYYGPAGEDNLGWAQYKNPEWDGALQDATQDPWKSICLAKHGVARFVSDPGGTQNRYRKPVHLFYRRSAQCRYISQNYSGTVQVTDTEITYTGTVTRNNDGPTISITHAPELPIVGNSVLLTFLPIDANGDDVTMTATIQPMGLDGNTPGTAMTICTDLPRSSGQAYQYTIPNIAHGYYMATATVKDAGGLTASASDLFQVVSANEPPEVTISTDKASYLEGDSAVISVLYSDPNGSYLNVDIHIQDLGESGLSPGMVDTVYTGTVVSGTIIRYTVPHMIPHPLSISASATDPEGLTDSAALTIRTAPRPIEGSVHHTDQWEENRLSYNAWADRTGIGVVRLPELFFRGENFILSAVTSQYLQSDYVHVYIQEYPEYQTSLTSTDGWNWTGEILGEDMRWWPSQQLTFVFENQYIDGTVTTDTVVVEIDENEYYRVHQLY